MAVYYPSVVVNLRVRFDESFQIETELPEPGPQSGDPKAEEVTGRTAPRNIRPLITRTGKDNLSHVADRVPKSANVELPSYRQAGKFQLEFDWRELPIDPRLVRACGVEIYIGTVNPEDFASGMTRVEADGRRRSVLRTTDEAGNPRDDLMALCGIVDSWFVQHGADNSIVRIEGRDLRGVFLDSPLDPEVLNKIDLSRPIPYVIADVLKGHPAAAMMEVWYNTDDWPGGVVPSVLDKEGLTRVRKSADGQGAGAGAEGVKAWDIITKWCFLVGAVPYFRGRNLVVRPAASLFDQSKPTMNSFEKVFDPAVRMDDDGEPFVHRKMVFGRNVQELTFERKLSGTKVPVVEVVSFDTSSRERGDKKLLIEQWPPADEELARISGVYPSGEVAQSDKLQISVPGIRDREKLLGIARSVYEEVGRGELGGSCRTNQLGSFKGGNEDPDMIRLRPGDMVEFLVDTRQLSSKAPNVSTLTDSHRRSFDEQVQEVMTALSGKTGKGDENLARVIVASARSTVIDLLRKFRTANVVFNWGASSGLQVAFDFQNYFVVRHGINEQLGKNVLPPVKVPIKSSTAERPKKQVRAQPKMKPRPKVEATRPDPFSREALYPNMSFPGDDPFKKR